MNRSSFLVGGMYILTLGLCTILAEANTPSSNTIHQSTPGISDQVKRPAVLDAEARFIQQSPGTQLYKQGTRTTRIYGRAFSHGNTPIQAAETFRAAHAMMFGVKPTDLHPGSRFGDHSLTQPVMYDDATDTYKFTLVYYSQFKDELPVYGSHLRLLARNEPGSPIVLASSALRDLGTFQVAAEMRANVTQPQYLQQQFELAQAEALRVFPTLVNFSPPEAIVWAGTDDMDVDPVVALTFVGDDFTPNGPSVEKWRFIADMRTGAILHQENQIIDVDVFGNVSGLATQGSGAEQCEAELPTPLPWARVNVGVTNAFADANGDYAFTAPGTPLMVTIESTLTGIYFNVFNSAGTDDLLSRTVAPPGPADFVHNFSNTEQSRAQVNGYLNANVVRDFTAFYNPAYPTFTDTGISVNVNLVGGICPGNAFYDAFDGASPTGYSINFCLSGGSSPNTAWTSVIFHEFGHHLVQAAGSGQGAYGEGMGDTMSTIILDESGTGFGFFGPCAQPLRDANNAQQFPCSGEIHFCGQLISGCVWSTRNELLATNPTTYLDILSNLAVNAILLHTGSSITPQITIDYLTLDDDDGDIGNGTPHYAEIDAGFGAHSMPAPALVPIDFMFPAGLPSMIIPDQTTTIPVNVGPVADTPVAGTGMIHTRIGSAGPFIATPMTEINPNQYEATLPAVPCLSTLEYYFSADSTASGTITDPSDAPTSVFDAISATGTAIAVSYDFETDPGWTVSGVAGATNGAWERGVPANGARGDPPADFDGSGQCWLTGNFAGNSDVDNGSTTLTSQIIDTSGLSAPQVTYARWFSNDTGGGPETDRLIIETSTDGGATWLELETVGPTSSSPNPEVSGGWFVKTYPITASAQFQIRFTAEDVGTQSVVEAAIDALDIFEFQCGLTIPAPPANVTATDGTSCEVVSVSWDAATGAADYEVWRNTANDSGTSTMIANGVATTTFDDNTVVTGTTYFYWVKACNGTGCSGFSLEAAGSIGLKGDFVADGIIDGEDIQGYVDALVSSPTFVDCADLAAPFGTLDAADTAAFVTLLLTP
ncbi:MAG: hypothetical protein ACE5EQ_04130 [Phycisphaerae bacterium]